MKICFVSDVHNLISKMELPPADALIVAGDWTMEGSVREISKFGEDLKKLKPKYRKILLIAGNHDFLAESEPYLTKDILSVATILEDSSYNLFGYKVHGSPWTPYCGAWAFQLRNWDMALRVWACVPTDTEILVTHTPPAGILDTEPPEWVNSWAEKAYEGTAPVSLGDKVLRYRLTSLKKLKVHAFGHIHGGYGTKTIKGVKYINCSSLERDYETPQKSIVIELKDRV